MGEFLGAEHSDVQCLLSLALWLGQVDPHAIIVDQLPTQASREEKDRQQDHTDQQVRIRGQEPNALTSRVPAVRSRDQREVIESRMRQRRLELWAHGLPVGFESLVAILHLDELLGTGHDGWDGSDEADGL